MGRVLLDSQPTVAIHRLGDIHQQRIGHWIATVGQQRVDYLFRVVTGRAGVPQPEGRQPVCVNVLGCPFQLSERRNRDPARVGIRMINFEEQRTVGLHHERPWAVEGRRHQRFLRWASDLSPLGVSLGESDSASGLSDSVGSADGVGDSEGVGVSVGSGEGLVTTNVGELRLWFPDASMARICTTC
jgi:hypothetical protein